MEDKTELYFGAMLHDIGKIVYRGFSGSGSHSKLGADFIANDVAALNNAFSTDAGKRIIEQIRYHHAREIRETQLPKDSLAYITYFADNISAGMDRKNEGEEDQKAQFDSKINLQKIFNIIDNRHDVNTIPHEDYNSIRERIKQQLAQIKIETAEVDSLLNLLEATCTTIPSSTNINELADISLFDHAKTTAGIAACVADYLDSIGESDYASALFSADSSPMYYEAKMFLLFSCDMSGIQNFIYTISGTGALKQLRARSLYLELLLEHVVDELLLRMGLCRANLLYSGGGHAYILLPNTQKVKREIELFQSQLKGWLVENFGTDLYLASAWVECSANDLSNNSEDKQRYPKLFRTLSERLSDKKANRYTAADIRQLNYENADMHDSSRECRECHRDDALLQDEDICGLCNSLAAISSNLAKKDVFAVVDINQHHTPKATAQLALPFDCALIVYSRDEYLAKKPRVRRVYTKNTWDTGVNLATHIWMGDYTAETNNQGIAAYAKQGITLNSEGIERLGVLRADVDNLGTIFASGIPAEKASISRTATLSRNLSMFFKKQINDILSTRGYQLQIIYSGGDDLFIIGNWSDIIYAAIDINNAFREYTGNGCLTLSAGVGMFKDKYPLARMASLTGELEDIAKLHTRKTKDGDIVVKNAIALWRDEFVFGWDEFSEIVEPRVRKLAEIFARCEKGKAFIYKLVDLLRHFDDVASAPRLAYLLARSFEGASDSNHLCSTFYGWATDADQRSYLITALEWYIYSIRERG